MLTLSAYSQGVAHEGIAWTAKVGPTLQCPHGDNPCANSVPVKPRWNPREHCMGSQIGHALVKPTFMLNMTPQSRSGVHGSIAWVSQVWHAHALPPSIPALC